MRSVKGKDTESSNKEIEMNMVYTDNPLQSMSDIKDATSNSDADKRVYELEMENADQKTEITDLKTENANKSQEITDQKAVITNLEEVIKELKRKYENNVDDKNADDL